MFLTVKEMELLCIFHAGTISATLESLRCVASGIEQPERKADAESVIAKLSGMKPGDKVSLSFDPE